MGVLQDDHDVVGRPVAKRATSLGHTDDCPCSYPIGVVCCGSLSLGDPKHHVPSHEPAEVVRGLLVQDYFHYSYP